MKLCYPKVYLINGEEFEKMEDLKPLPFPNPTRNILSYKPYANQETSDNSVLVYDAKGSLIKTFTYALNKGFNSLEFDVSELSTGIYVFHFLNDECLKKVKISVYR